MFSAIIGVDTGGTFTDFALVRAGKVWTYKTASTPDDYSRGLLQGIVALLDEAGVGKFDFVHSSTVATNTLLERKGAKTALITTKGFRDVIEIGRQTRPELYNLFVERPAPLVPREGRYEVAERISAEGEILVPLKPAEVKRIVARIKKSGFESVAVSLLFSFLRPEHEQAIAAISQKAGLAVSLSSQIISEFREYERTGTTVVNGYVSPVMRKYLDKLSVRAVELGADKIRIVQSNGGSLSTRSAGRDAVHTLLSGPAAGVIGALSVVRQAFPKQAENLKLITFDMGGTSTDVSLVAGDYRVTSESVIDGLPVAVPMMDIRTVGAGGGSIAYVDAGGALHVGPRSAGADPGPACYGKGEEAAVTDANLLLGRIDPANFLGGRMKLHAYRSRSALEKLASRLGTDTRKAAESVIRIVNSNMERALRVISIERGYDPREFTLVSFGGAGGLHACDLADALRIPRLFIPRNPGVLSAWGAVSGNVVKDFSRTVMAPFGRGAGRTASVFSALGKTARLAMNDEGFSARTVLLERKLDIRYAGQSFELTVSYDGGLKNSGKLFHEEHLRRYGHCSEKAPMEIVTARLRAVGFLEKPVFQKIPVGGRSPEKAVINRRGKMTIYKRDFLRAGNVIIGPALIIEDFATTLLPKGWKLAVDKFGNMEARKS